MTRHIKLVLFAPFFVLFLSRCVPIAQQSATNFRLPDSSNASPVLANVSYYVDKKLRMENVNYEPTIKTVQLYAKTGIDLSEKAVVLPAPVVILTEQDLLLEFDELIAKSHSPFHVKIFHCNADWTVSMLNDIEFLSDYNDFTINTSEYSANTKVPYIHYKFDLPKVKISGNYVIMVYRDGNVKDIMLTQRFMIYENLVQIQSTVKSSSGVRERSTNQQIDFSINYQSYSLVNPRESVKVTLRQNENWTNAIQKLAPYSVKEDVNLLEYNFFNLENNFSGGNEYRFFDMRSLKFIGQNVGHLNITNDSNRVFLLTDKPRKMESYSRFADQDGSYVIDNYERGNGPVQADYAKVKFLLKSPEVDKGEVYILGALTNWQLSEENNMKYNAESQSYEADLWLKQGYYNFNYVLKKDNKLDEIYFEGSHFDTENKYEIIVYYRPMGARNDLIIGYKQISYNSK